jgi:hypothetical protein
LSFSQSRYPLQTVIDGDSVVILTKAQADTINAIFDSQKARIAQFKEDTKVKDSIIAIRDTLLVYYTTKVVEYRTVVDNVLLKDDRLDTLSAWLYKRAVENAWIYYSYIDGQVVAVDLSNYVVRKDDYTGDILFYRRTEDCPADDKERREPEKGWQLDVARPTRPKLNTVKLRL